MTGVTTGGPYGPRHPHRYALLLQPLTDDEYTALKADIKVNGVMYPIITDEEGAILDGVHRDRICTELDISDPPVHVRAGLTDEAKLHLAVGLNLRRRQIDGTKRCAVVRKLRREEGLSERKIADITGWSRATVRRDLKETPYERMIEAANSMGSILEALPEDHVVRQAMTEITGISAGFYTALDSAVKDGMTFTNGQKLEVLLTEHIQEHTMRIVMDKLRGREPPYAGCIAESPTCCAWPLRWEGWTTEQRSEMVAKLAAGEHDNWGWQQAWDSSPLKSVEEA